MTGFDSVIYRQTTREQRQSAGKESEKGTMQPCEELSLLIESVEDDLARAIRSGNVMAARQFAQELRARFFIYRDACADAGVVWARLSQREQRRSAWTSRVLYCMTTSLSGHGEGLGTVGLPEGKLQELAREAGFSSVQLVPLENPFNNLYEITPWQFQAGRGSAR